MTQNNKYELKENVVKKRIEIKKNLPYIFGAQNFKIKQELHPINNIN